MRLRPTAVIGTQPFEGCQEARELLSALAVMRDRLSDVACEVQRSARNMAQASEEIASLTEIGRGCPDSAGRQTHSIR